MYWLKAGARDGADCEGLLFWRIRMFGWHRALLYRIGWVYGRLLAAVNLAEVA